MNGIKYKMRQLPWRKVKKLIFFVNKKLRVLQHCESQALLGKFVTILDMGYKYYVIEYD